jgi:hypothetical protein
MFRFGSCVIYCEVGDDAAPAGRRAVFGGLVWLWTFLLGLLFCCCCLQRLRGRGWGGCLPHLTATLRDLLANPSISAAGITH